MLGQTACAMAAIGGANHIIVLEPDAPAAQRSAFGATVALDSTWPNDRVIAQVLDRTTGRGADVGIEVCRLPRGRRARPGSLGRDWRTLRHGGRDVSRAVRFNGRPSRSFGEMLQIVGVYNYEPEDLETALISWRRFKGGFRLKNWWARRIP